MLHQKLKATAFFALLFAAFFSFDAAAISAQTEDVAKLREQARVLFERNNYAEALPILEKIAVAAPDDASTLR